MAQLVAHLLCKQGVRGSSPLSSTMRSPNGVAVRASLYFRSASLLAAEDNAAKPVLM